MIIYEHIFSNNGLQINEIEAERKKKVDIGNFKGTLQKSLRIDEYDIVKSTMAYGYVMYSENKNKDEFLKEIKVLQENKINKIIEDYHNTIDKEKGILDKISSLL